MSHLSDHARAFRILADVWVDEFTSQTDEHLCLMAGMLSSGYGRAADRMEAEARADIVGHACTIDHRAMGSTACPACKAPRG
jgi:hypothetical protein